MTTNRPKDALLELEKARPLDQRAADVMYLRGRAYLQAGMLSGAEFRKLLASKYRAQRRLALGRPGECG